MDRSYLHYDWTPVINFESGGKSYYNKYLKKISWPGGASGLTIGIGADLGYMSKDEFNKYFKIFFREGDAIKLAGVIGLKGTIAKNKLTLVSGIELSWEDSMQAFIDWTLPKFWKLTNTIWPGTNELCESAQVALVSIVFNRGVSLKGSSRVEMRNIKNYVAKKNYMAISSEIKSMKRLWVGKNLDGLLSRRDMEAALIEKCV